MRIFFCFALAVCVGTFLGLFSSEEYASSSEAAVETVATKKVSSIRFPKRGEVLKAANKLAPHTRVPVSILLAICEQETNLGANQGEVSRALRRARSIKEQIILDVLAKKQGMSDPDLLKVSPNAAFGLVQARPSYYLHHTGMEIDFGSTPTVLLHGTDQYRNMSRGERAAGIKAIQHKLGLRGDDLDGVVGGKTLDAIRRAAGTRSFDRLAKYRLVKKFFADQVKVKTAKSKDKVWRRICLAEGKDPRKAKYFMPDLWDPLHAFAYASVHIEDDLRLAGGKLDIAIAAYYTGIGSAKQGCRDGVWYRRQVKAKAKKYASASLAKSNVS